MLHENNVIKTTTNSPKVNEFIKTIDAANSFWLQFKLKLRQKERKIGGLGNSEVRHHFRIGLHLNE